MKEEIWAQKSAVSIHNETAGWFANQYEGKKQDHFSSSFVYGREQINDSLFKEVSKLPRGAKILDIGCGTGDHLKRFIDLGFEAVGIEPSENMRRYAESKLPQGTIIDGSVLNLPFSDNSFDFVCAIEVFRYLNKEDNIRGFKEILRVLKPNGLFFGTFLNLYALNGFNFLVFVRKLRERFFGKPLRFHSEFETQKELKKKLIYTGFSKVKIYGAMIAFLIIFYRINRTLGKVLAKILEPVDPYLSDIPTLQPFANYLIAITKK
jgi:ubiquinone/menaquinone biosynthesis C-methylase UbiE